MHFKAITALFFTIGSMGSAQQLPLPITDGAYSPVNLQEAELGQLLFYDAILSGNRETACATCHHPKFGTSDGVALSFGDGASGLGPERRVDVNNLPEERVPRNSPAMFNLGAKEFTSFFHDGRLETDPSRKSGIRTPMDADMVSGFASALSAQSMFPVLSRDEMAGSYRENDIAKLVRQGIITGKGGAWDRLARRVAGHDEYVEQFVATYPHISNPSDIAFTDIANAIAAFIAFEWRSDTSPFDAFLRGESELSAQAQRGFEMFYGEGNCASCHAGPFLSDHKFHAMGAPQIGPGKSASFQDHHRDEGRFNVTRRAEDRFAFRTPSLRNIALTAPYGHAGAHTDLAQFIADHADPVEGLIGFDRSQVNLLEFEADDFAVLNDPQQVQDIASAVITAPIALSGEDIADLIAFLDTLTDPLSIKGRLGVPQTVPSKLPVPN